MSDIETRALPPGLPAPSTEEPLSAPYWKAAREGRLLVQKCRGCAKHQWGPEWICHRCHSFDLDWVEVAPRGRVYSWQRPHHPVHPALAGHGPYTIVLVELPEADSVRMVGNLLGASDAPVGIGAAVEAVFERHDGAEPPFALVQWKTVG